MKSTCRLRLVTLLSVALTPAALVAGDAPVAGSFTIRADWFDRGNIRVSTPGQSYADKFACIWNAGKLPNQAEYDLDFPVTAQYTFVALYTAHDSRPVDILLDGKKVHGGFAAVTGSWATSAAAWEKQCTFPVTQGNHTITLICPGACMPHICAFRLESPLAFPKGWKLDRAVAKERRRLVNAGDDRNVKPHMIPAVPLPPTGGMVENLTVELAAANDLYGDAVNNELLPEPEGVDIGVNLGKWVAKYSIRSPNGEPKQVTVALDPAQSRTILLHTIELVDEFRTVDGVAADFLNSERAEAQRMLDRLGGLVKDLLDSAAWREFAHLQLAAAALEHRVALANPLLNFDRLLMVERRLVPNEKGHGGHVADPYGLPQNWQSNSSIRNDTWDNRLAVLSPIGPQGNLSTLHKPQGPYFVGDVDLDFDGLRMLFSSVGEGGRWQVFEIKADGSALRQITPDLGDVNNYDACYLPDGRIIFSSTASMAAVPCVNGSSLVANFYLMNPDGSGIRQLCFDQEHNWCPTVLNNGRVLYLRWEYTDTPHSHDRVLFHMNPDGTGQMEYYGSNSYWPNSLFYARPIPGDPTKFVGIVGGHHGARRMGELVLFDPALGRREAQGAIQRIPGRGRKVEALIEDNLVDNSWPKFLHPYPLSEKYFLVAAQPTAKSEWGIYLADVFDNMLLIKEQPGYALLEPVPLRATPTPPRIPDRIDPSRKDAVVYLSDVYSGGGLAGVPRGSVKSLRIVGYHFLYPHMGGPQGVVGMEGPWDIKRIIGTVPVDKDGSAVFRIPANTPLMVQPLDAEGKALQLMRSWFTGMPGEVISCVGCHESQNSGPLPKSTQAAYRSPSEITPWYGPARGFNFAREVQPVLDKYCIGCHDGREDALGQPIVDLRGLEKITDYTSVFHYGAHDAGHFSTSYAVLHRFVRRPGLESDYHLLTPMEFHADTTQLVQLLSKGHHNVQLDPEAWDRLITWIDLNAPFHGTWTEIAGRERVEKYAKRRSELLKLYANVEDDPEAIFRPAGLKIQPVVPQPQPEAAATKVDCPDWPITPDEARRRQESLGNTQRSIDLGDGVTLELTLIPAGEFVIGSPDRHPDERPMERVKIARPFWMGRIEVTNRQYARFDPAHDSGVESKFAMQFGVRGFYVNGPDQPVVRVSWHEAAAFCQWLSEKTGERFELPSEAEWEYACRAGTQTPFHYGDLNTDFSAHANLADATISEYVCHPYKKDREPYAKPSKYDDWIPKDARFDDNGFVSDSVGAYQPNVWGLFDMHGNVAEWTRSAFRPYPYRDDGRNAAPMTEDRTVRGGSWRDRPFRATSSFRLPYRPYQPVYNVGFRVVSPTTNTQQLTASR